jgi:antitoxin CptB
MAMTGSTRSSEGLDARRRRMLFRSWHRGIKEMDLIMGRFSDAHIAELSDRELDDYERLMEMRDQEVLSWIDGTAAVPADHDTPLFRRLRDFNHKVDR